LRRHAGRDISLERGERVIVSVRGKLTSRRTIWLSGAGRVAVTDQALRFEPSWIDYVTGWRPRRVKRSDIRNVTVLPRERIMLPRLTINVNDGPTLVFLTDEARAEAVARALGH
jgi:hypothetical protein